MEHPHPHSSSSTPHNGLQGLLRRLEDQSRQPDFLSQSQQALSLALRPYLDMQQEPRLLPLPEEEELAKWFLFADYLPTDGHSSLIEQVRDLITEHVPEEERVWLDPLRHSYMDLLEVTNILGSESSAPLQLHSLGDQQAYQVPVPQSPIGIQTGQVLVTRILKKGTEACLPEPILLLSNTIGKAVLREAETRRKEIEIGTGNFTLSEWGEFAKNYGYFILWSVAHIRRGAIREADAHTPYLGEQGQPYLYAWAIYEHSGLHALIEGISELDEFDIGQAQDSQLWVGEKKETRAEPTSPIQAKVTVTPTHLFVESDSQEQLDSIKHQLARTFGYTLHFKGEETEPPLHRIHEVDLLSDTYHVPVTTVSAKDDHERLKKFLETVFLEWAEQPSSHLDGQTPRHYRDSQQHISKVKGLLTNMEKYDWGVLRNGQRAYDYDILRRHVGLE